MGKYTTAQPASYNTQIAPNGTASFGFCGTSVAGGKRPVVKAYNMEMNLFMACESNGGVNPTLAGLAVAMGIELGRWEPDQDLLVSGGKTILNPAAVCVANSCKNTKAILGQQAWTSDQSVFNNTNYSATLGAMFDRQKNLIANLNANDKAHLPPDYKLTFVGGPTSFGFGNCGPHYIWQVDYKSGVNAGKPLSAQDAANMSNTLCFYGQGNCGNNPYIGFVSTGIASCPSGKTCLAIDPTDGDNGSTATTTAGSAPTYPKNMVYDPANSLLGTMCITTKGALGTMTSKCASFPDTCGNLYCVAN
jgi:hypothetical protein